MKNHTIPTWEEFEELLFDNLSLNSNYVVNKRSVSILTPNKAMIVSIMIDKFRENSRMAFSLSIKEMEAMLGLGETAIFSCIQQLVQMGIIQKQRFGNDPSLYYIVNTPTLYQILYKSENTNCPTHETWGSQSAKTDSCIGSEIGLGQPIKSGVPIKSGLGSSLIIDHSIISSCKESDIEESYSHACACEEERKKTDAELDAEFLGKIKPKKQSTSFDAKKFMREQDEFSVFGEQPKEDRSKRAQNSPDYVQEIFDFWQSKNLHKHRFMPAKLKEHVDFALKHGYTLQDIKDAIGHYETMFNDKKCWINSQNVNWGLDTFIDKFNPRFEKFVEDGEHWINYLKDKKKNSNPQCFNKELQEVAAKGHDALMQKMEEDKAYLRELLKTAKSI